MTGYALAFLGGGLSLWLVGLWFGRAEANSKIPAGSSAIVFGEESVSMRMPNEDGEASGTEVFAFGLFMLVTERNEALVELVRAKVEEIADE